MRRQWWLAAMIVPLAAGCDRLFEGACPADLRYRITPAERTLAPGGTFTARAEVLTCGGRDRRGLHARWRTADTLVVRVDSVTGVITGRTVGDARVRAHEVGRTGPSDFAVGEVRVLVR